MAQRKFYPGDKWVYYKLYVGHSLANQILLDHINPFTKLLLQQKLIDRWFFIRYKDPYPHIRLRFHIISKEFFGELVSQFQHLFQGISDDIVWKIEMATYSRELERYGTTSIKQTEKFFCHDSELMLSLLSYHPSDQLCFLFVLKLIDFRLECFNFTLKEKVEFLKTIDLSFKNEFHCDKRMAQSLSKKYRTLTTEIDKVMDVQNKEYAVFHELLEKDKTSILFLIEEIMAKKNNRLEESDINDYVASLIHMSINRLFRSKQRVYEMLAYDFSYRYFNSKISRSKII